jgi:hypothetical protein
MASFESHSFAEPEEDDDEPVIEFVAPISASALAAQAARDAVKVEQAEMADRQSRAALRERDLAEMRLLNSGAAAAGAAAMPMYSLDMMSFLLSMISLAKVISVVFAVFDSMRSGEEFSQASAAAHGMLPPPDVGMDSGHGPTQGSRAAAAEFKSREPRRKPAVPVPADFYRAPPKPEEKRVCGVPTGSCVVC